MNKIVPKFDRVLVKRDSLTKSDSPIILPSHREAPSSGTVIAVGPTAGVYRNGELVESIQVGSKIVFGTYAGRDLSTFVNAKEGTYWLIQDQDVLCVIEDVKE